MTDTVKVLSDDERIAQIRERQGYRAEWAYGDDIEFLLNQNTGLREQLAESERERNSLRGQIVGLNTQLAQVTQERDKWRGLVQGQAYSES